MDIAIFNTTINDLPNPRVHGVQGARWRGPVLCLSILWRWPRFTFLLTLAPRWGERGAVIVSPAVNFNPGINLRTGWLNLPTPVQDASSSILNGGGRHVPQNACSQSSILAAFARPRSNFCFLVVVEHLRDALRPENRIRNRVCGFNFEFMIASHFVASCFALPQSLNRHRHIA